MSRKPNHERMNAQRIALDDGCFHKMSMFDQATRDRDMALASMAYRKALASVQAQRRQGECGPAGKGSLYFCKDVMRDLARQPTCLLSPGQREGLMRIARLTELPAVKRTGVDMVLQKRPPTRSGDG